MRRHGSLGARFQRGKSQQAVVAHTDPCAPGPVMDVAEIVDTSTPWGVVPGSSAQAAPVAGNFKDVQFYPIPYSFGHFWAALLKISGFHPHPIFSTILGRPHFSAVRSTFWPKRRPKILNFYPTRNFGHFWAALLKMSGFTPTRNFGHFWAPSLVTLLIFRNVMTREHLNTLNTLNTKTPKNQTPKP